MNSTFNVDSTDSTNTTNTNANTTVKAPEVLSSLENNRKSTRTSKSKLLADKLRVEDVRSSDEFEKPPSVAATTQRSKRSGEVAFQELEASSREIGKRKRTLLCSGGNASYFGPLP